MKRFLKTTLLFAMAALLFTSCNCYKKMKKNVDVVQATSAPSVLSLQGKDVKATYTLQFPANYYNKKAVLRITPIMVYASGVIEGTPYYVQGEKVKDNYTVIRTATGGSVSQSVTFPFSESMRISHLELRIDSKCKGGALGTFGHFATIKIADGVSTVQELADLGAKAAIAPDNFKRNTVISQDANVMFTINKANVRSEQLTSSEIKALEDFIVENSGDAKKTVGNVYTKGYASPDGPTNFNNKLSQDRARNTESAVNRKYTNDKMPVTPKFDVEALGEDWEGFKALVEASNIQDKNLILQVLNMYNDSERRESEIKNMASVYTVLKDKILPQLRRTKLQVDVDVMGLTDAELRAAVDQNISKLNLEETLFAATLYTDNATKQKIYKSAADRFNDYRAWNNYAVTLFNDGKVSEAQSALSTASRLNNSSNEVINNMGLVALASGNYADARRYLTSINTADSRYNVGLLNVFEGNYTDAVRAMDGYNQAVAYVLNGDMSRAKTLLTNVNTAEGEYLKAVIAAREGDSAGVIANLRNSFSKDASLKARAKKDIEFAKWANASDFTSLLN